MERIPGEKLYIDWVGDQPELLLDTATGELRKVHIFTTTVSMDNKGVFYVSLCVKYVIDIESKKSEKVLGLDYSQHDFYVDSNGKKCD